jgi:hypothetical protein
MIKKVEELDFDLLKAMTKELNAATYKKGEEDVPFLAKKVKAIATTKANLAAAFDKAVQGIDPNVINDLPEKIIDYYNANFADEGGGEAASAPEAAKEAPAPEAAKEAPAPAKPKKEKAAPAADKPKKVPPKKDVPLSCFGHQEGSQAAKLDELLAPGNPISLDDLAKKSGRSPLGVKSHIKHLIEARKQTITEKDGVYTLVPVKK